MQIFFLLIVLHHLPKVSGSQDFFFVIHGPELTCPRSWWFGGGSDIHVRTSSLLTYTKNLRRTSFEGRSSFYVPFSTSERMDQAKGEFLRKRSQNPRQKSPISRKNGLSPLPSIQGVGGGRPKDEEKKAHIPPPPRAKLLAPPTYTDCTYSICGPHLKRGPYLWRPLLAVWTLLLLCTVVVTA